ncbi:MarR family transcriptional regulator [Vibrio sp. B172a]|jgi:DNA-binding MarR family transcriptional regulator|uniref:MarR family transcriptional regulator n=1 Tax=Vibrio jasicida TaxID=766224 RepID=A0AAU9QIG7_9VIBR|nr:MULTISPECIES: MarR family transcriptional regulator [Vibrio]KIP73327.1 MarR family transcriptional regulator [Vibrio harveyi]KIP74471.1 MarR family transcriptional regulator [Vibrio harveyi]MDK9784628.1 MarR family transcriptional regulator [Vibrio sp. B172a]PAW11636.1 MarR family transcriptional regulator [Vibrio sp. V1B]PMO45632.1 MarR family transcriptional regulator [Vibrio sp. 10N.222.52.B12]
MSNPKSLDNLFHLVHVLKRQLHEQIEQLELPIAPMHVRVIKIISKQSPCTAMDVVNFLNRDKAQVTRLIKTLIEEGFIEKRPNPEDKRSQCLLTTEKGNEVLSKIKAVDAEIFQKMTLNVSEEELEAFQLVAGKLAENLSKKPS